MYLNAQHFIAESAEAQRAHRVCHQPTPISVTIPASHDRPGVAEEAPISFCGSNWSRTTAYHGSLVNAYDRWSQDRMRALPDVDETAESAGDGS